VRAKCSARGEQHVRAWVRVNKSAPCAVCGHATWCDKQLVDGWRGKMHENRKAIRPAAAQGGM